PAETAGPFRVPLTGAPGPAAATLSATPSGTITEYGGLLSAPFDITAGPDGNLWFTEPSTGKIGKSTTAGAITEYGGSLSFPQKIVTGPDGNLWFTEAGNGKI